MSRTQATWIGLIAVFCVTLPIYGPPASAAPTTATSGAPTTAGAGVNASAAGASSSSTRTPQPLSSRRRSALIKVIQPRRGAATVRVSGPYGYHKTLHHTELLTNLSVGTYRVRALRDHAGGETSYPTVSKKKFRIRARSTARRITVSYFDTVFDTTEVIKAGELVRVGFPTAGTDVAYGTVRLTKQASLGDVLASGPSRKDSDGFLVKVIGVVSHRRFIYRVRPATLREAIPRGDFDEPMALKVSEGNLNLNMDGAQEHAFSSESTSRQASRALAAPKASPAARSLVGTRGLVDLATGCDTSALSVKFDSAIDGGFETRVGGSWDTTWDDPIGNISLWASGEPRFDASVQLQATGSGSCPIPEKILKNKDYSPHTFFIGPVPIVIVPRITMVIGGSLSASNMQAGFAATVGFGGKLSVTASTNSSGLSTSHNFVGNVQGQAGGSASSATIDTRLGVYFTGELYGLVGPTLKASFGPEFKYSADKGWEVGPHVRLDGGIRIDRCLDLYVTEYCLHWAKLANLVDKRFPKYSISAPPDYFPPGPAGFVMTTGGNLNAYVNDKYVKVTDTSRVGLGVSDTGNAVYETTGTGLYKCTAQGRGCTRLEGFASDPVGVSFAADRTGYVITKDGYLDRFVNDRYDNTSVYKFPSPGFAVSYTGTAVYATAGRVLYKCDLRLTSCTQLDTFASDPVGVSFASDRTGYVITKLGYLDHYVGDRFVDIPDSDASGGYAVSYTGSAVYETFGNGLWKCNALGTGCTRLATAADLGSNAVGVSFGGARS